MKILIAHNFYQQPGGEDQCFRAEMALLQEHGHTVIHFTRHNDQLKAMGALTAARATVWNQVVSREFRAQLHTERPDIIHVHNTFPLLSPALYHAAEGIPVVQTLHNYRLLCPDALFFRDGQVCEECIDKRIKWPGVLHACYRNSRPASAVTALMLFAHGLLKTWSEKVTAYIALTEFARSKLVEGGLPASKIVIKPNFIPHAPAPGAGRGNYALFIGRLAPEKGIETLLSAWQSLDIPLKIAGDGPLGDKVRLAAAQHSQIAWLGHVPSSEVQGLLQDAAALIFPSTWYENMPLVILEAFAAGTPVIASRLGAAAELVKDGQTGLHFRAGDAADLAEKVSGWFEHPADQPPMRQAARIEFEAKYTAERNYAQLMTIYERAIATAGH